MEVIGTGQVGLLVNVKTKNITVALGWVILVG